MIKAFPADRNLLTGLRTLSSEYTDIGLILPFLVLSQSYVMQAPILLLVYHVYYLK